jgi:acetyltransferase
MLGRFHGVLASEPGRSHEGLARLCFIDYAREIRLVAVHREPGAAEAEILGVARLGRVHGRDTAEFAVAVADRWQRRGLGTVLLGKLLAVGRAEGVTRLAAMVPDENAGMRRLCENLGFRLTVRPGERRWIAAINLLRAGAPVGPGGAVPPARGQAARDEGAEAGRPATKNAHDRAIAAEAPL